MTEPHELLRDATNLVLDAGRHYRRALRCAHATDLPPAGLEELLRCAELAGRVELLASALVELAEAAAVVAQASRERAMAGEPLPR